MTYILVGLSASLLVALGLAGIVSSRNSIRMLLSSELLYNAGLLLLLLFSAIKSVQATLLALMVIVLATTEVAVLVAIIMLFYRKNKTLDVRAAATEEGV